MGWFVLAALAAFVAVVAVRTALFRPKAQPAAEPVSVSVDEKNCVRTLQALVQCRTVSNADPALEDDAEFERLVAMLPRLYPNVFVAGAMQRLPDRALLIRIPGKSDKAPTVLMSHYDVVPVDEEKWEKPPFAGIIEDGVLWGRGTLDTKVTMNAALSAADSLVGQGFVPENDVYFAFSGGEEVNGRGAVNIVEYFVKNRIQPALVLDEGGAVVEGSFPGVKAPTAMVGIAEKGMINAQFRCCSNGGHASAPKPHTPVGILAAACKRLEDHPFKGHITGPVAMMFDTLGRHSTLLYRVIFANMWCFGWVIDLLGRMSGGEMNALVRTTVAFTQMEGSSARNVLPTEAKMVANMRLNPADSVESALEYLSKTVGDEQVEVTALESHEPSPVSEVDCPAWDKVAAAVSQTWPGCIVTPYLMVQCADARHYRDLSNHVYRFSAMALTPAERATIHGNNERITLENIVKATQFYARLLKMS
ncbi:MAG: M20/M25/M40 family metallo-hydrolase [Ruminococcaceae bacterium]|nr:M20/M25/M40 family metallo-hydrolase [Oscillospiraceae bacterium]